jgi:hypothetical protein
MSICIEPIDGLGCSAPPISSHELGLERAKLTRAAIVKLSESHQIDPYWLAKGVLSGCPQTGHISGSTGPLLLHEIKGSSATPGEKLVYIRSHQPFFMQEENRGRIVFKRTHYKIGVDK